MIRIMARSRFPVIVTLTILSILLLATTMVLGGGYLAALGGSWYYLIAGLVLLLVGGLLLAGHRSAITLYGLLLLGTLAWTLYEVRFDWWQLAPRIDLWCILGLWLFLPFVNRQVGRSGVWRDGATGVLGVGILAGALMAGYSLTQDYHSIDGEFSDAQMQGDAAGGVAQRLSLIHIS